MREDKEKLCLLFDGESNPGDALNLLRRIENDPALQEQWRRYNLLSESLRSQRVLVPDRQFVARVSMALAEEPAVLAPPRKTRPRLPQTAVTLALAASLALMAVLIGKSLHGTPNWGTNLLAQSRNGVVEASVDPRFQDYLVAHYETTYLAGAQGILPSVRLVSADATR